MNKTTKISLRVIAVFGVAMLVSLIPDYAHDFFGDWKCQGRWWEEAKRSYIGCDYGLEPHVHNPYLHWGYRHWLFLFMGLCLFALQVSDIIKIMDKE
jgi:hypothetical protein